MNVDIKLPGKLTKEGDNVFTIKFEKRWFEEGNILDSFPGVYKLKVLKVYKFNWFRRMYSKIFNKPVKLMDCIRVEQIKK